MANDSTDSYNYDRSVDDIRPEMSRVEVIPDPDSETVTFVRRRPDDDGTTTAWITADANLVIDPNDMQ